MTDRRPSEADDLEWTVISAEGALLGIVRIPRGLTITDIAADAILGVARDELGVERVRLYTLSKPATN